MLKRSENLGMAKPSDSKNQRRNPHNQPKPKRGPWWMFGQHDAVAGFTGWVAILTGLIVVAGFCQFAEFVISERAFVFISDIKLQNTFLEANKPLRVLVDIKNSGKETAVTSDFRVTGLKVARLPDAPDYSRSQNDIRVPPMPGGEVYKTDFIIQAGVDQQTLDAINAGQISFYIFGYIRYSDHVWPFWDSIYRFCYYYDLGR